MSVVIENDGSISDSTFFLKCRQDEEWLYHYRRYIDFKHMKEWFDMICFDEYERMSLREEELGVGVTDCGTPF